MAVRALLVALPLTACAAEVTGGSHFVGSGGPVGTYALPVTSVAGTTEPRLSS